MKRSDNHILFTSSSITMTSVVDKYMLIPQERYNRLSHPTQKLHEDHQTFTHSNEQGLKNRKSHYTPTQPNNRHQRAVIKHSSIFPHRGFLLMKRLLDWEIMAMMMGNLLIVIVEVKMKAAGLESGNPSDLYNE